MSDIAVEYTTDGMETPGTPDSDINVLAKGSGVALLGKLASRGLQLVTVAVLARLLGPVAYGLYAISQTVLQVGQQVGTLGLDNGVIRFGGVIRGKGDSGLAPALQQSMFLSLASGLLAGAVIFLLAPFVAIRFFHQTELVGVLRVMAIVVALTINLRVISAATRLSRRMQFSVLAEDIAPALVNLVLAGVLVYWLKMSLQGAVIAVSVGYAAGWVMALYFLRLLFPVVTQLRPLDWILAKALLAFSVPTLLAGIFNLLIQSSSILLLGYFRSPAEAGIYQAAAQISTPPAVILMALNAIFVPMIPGLHESGQKERLKELFTVSTKWGLYVSLPLFLMMILIPGQILTALFGRTYASGAWSLVILSAAQLVNAGTGAVAFLLIMTHHEKRWLLISGACSIGSLLLNWLLIPRWGVTGAAIATGCGISGLFIVALLQVRAELGLWPYDRRYVKGLIAMILVAIGLIAAKNIFGLYDLVSLTIAGLLSLAIFWGALLLLGIDTEDKTFLATFLEVFKRRLRSAR
jgi:O-antigen/teichoic acid export membrane protein